MGKEIPESSRLEFLEKFLANNFALSDAEDNTSGPLNRGGIADLPLLRTLLAIRQKSREPSFWEVMDSCFISICKFGSFKNPFATITSLSELYFRIRRFMLLLQTKKVISMNYGSSTSSWKPWRWERLNPIFTMRGICINSNLKPLTKCTSGSRSTKFKYILPWNISHIITKTIPTKSNSTNQQDHTNQDKNSHMLCDETGYPVSSLLEIQWKLRQEHDQNFPMKEKSL